MTSLVSNFVERGRVFVFEISLQHKEVADKNHIEVLPSINDLEVEAGLDWTAHFVHCTLGKVLLRIMEESLLNSSKLYTAHAFCKIGILCCRR